MSARQRRRRGIRGCRRRHSPCVVFASRQHPPPSTSLSSTSAARPSSASSPLLSLVIRRAWRAPHPFELRAPWPPRGSCPADSAGQMHPLRRRLKAKKKMTRRASLSSSSSLLVRGRSSSQSLFIFEWTLLFLLRIFFCVPSAHPISFSPLLAVCVDAFIPGCSMFCAMSPLPGCSTAANN